MKKKVIQKFGKVDVHIILEKGKNRKRVEKSYWRQRYVVEFERKSSGEKIDTK